MNNETMPNFFTQIPSYVMKSKELNPTDKCVYGVIYTMLNVTHQCFMSNARIAEDINSTISSVSRSITKMKRLGLLNVQITYKEGTKQVDKRFVELSNIFLPPIRKNEHTPTSNMSTPIRKNEQDNRLFNKSVEYDDDERARGENSVAKEKSLQDVVNNYQRNIGVLNGNNIDDLEIWSNDLPIDLINYAVDLAADNNASSFSYVKSILNKWWQHNIRTLEQAKAKEVKRQNASANKGYSRQPKRRERLGEDEELGF